jgi:hypothetical protein
VWSGGARGRGAERGRGSRRVGHYGLARVAGLKWTVVFYNYSKIFKQFELIWLKGGLPMLEKIKIKYGIEGLEERNDFLHRNFFRFEVKFKWKFRGASSFEIQ